MSNTTCEACGVADGAHMSYCPRLAPIEVEAILEGRWDDARAYRTDPRDVGPVPEPPVDTWMAPYSDEMQESLVATGALWMLVAQHLSDYASVYKTDGNTLELHFHGRLLRGSYTVTVEQKRTNPEDEDEPF